MCNRRLGVSKKLIRLSASQSSKEQEPSLAKLLVVFPHPLREFLRHGVAIDWHERIGFLAAGEFLDHSIAKLRERRADFRADDVPLGFEAVTLEFCTNSFCPLANARDLRAESGLVHHFLDTAETVFPINKAVASQRPRLFTLDSAAPGTATFISTSANAALLAGNAGKLREAGAPLLSALVRIL
jgi:hypothetical protein